MRISRDLAAEHTLPYSLARHRRMSGLYLIATRCEDTRKCSVDL